MIVYGTSGETGHAASIIRWAGQDVLCLWLVLRAPGLKHGDLQSEYPFFLPFCVLPGMGLAAVGIADPGAGSGGTENRRSATGAGHSRTARTTARYCPDSDRAGT